jgi:hypothetical protein
LRFWVQQSDETTLPATVASFTTLLQAMTSLQVIPHIGPPTVIVPRPTVTQYVSAQDKARFVFQDLQGSFHRFQLPGPLVSIFEPDQVTVNPANSAVAAFVTAFISTACNQGNVKFSAFFGGLYIRQPLPRRGSIVVLAPDGTTPEE